MMAAPKTIGSMAIMIKMAIIMTTTAVVSKKCSIKFKAISLSRNVLSNNSFCPAGYRLRYIFWYWLPVLGTGWRRREVKTFYLYDLAIRTDRASGFIYVS